MRLRLSSAAAPDAELAALVKASSTRGLMLVELREGDACLRSADDPLADAVPVAGILPRAGTDSARLAAISRAARAPAIVFGAERLALAGEVTTLGGRALPLMQGAAEGGSTRSLVRISHTRGRSMLRRRNSCRTRISCCAMRVVCLHTCG